MRNSAALAKAIRIAAEAFEMSFDKGGRPYIFHCLAVMRGVEHRGVVAMTAAVLHDLLEDCPQWSAERLRQEGVSEEVTALIERLTHRSGETYAAYISRVAACPEAKAIKLADLRHNMELTRLPALHGKDIERLRKYHQAYAALTGKGGGVAMMP